MSEERTEDAGWRAWNECRIREEETMRLLADIRVLLSCECPMCAHLAPSVEVLLPRIDRALGPDPVIYPPRAAAPRET